ncbi:hypothetical protein MNJPNG_04890 [Cupriavidus oxalaticus]
MKNIVEVADLVEDIVRGYQDGNRIPQEERDREALEAWEEQAEDWHDGSQ